MSDERALLVRLEASLATFEKQMQRGYQTAAKFSTDIEGRFVKMEKATRNSAAGSAQAIGREMDALRTKFDPLFAASKRYEAELTELNRAHKVGAIDARTHAAALAELNRGYAASSGAADGAAGGLGRVMNVSRSARSAIQNTSYQVSDMAVQFEMGTDPMRIMAQQLPQIAGGFAGMGGALGVVLPVLGSVLAIGLPIAAMLFANGEASQSFEEKTNALTESINELNSATDAMMLDTDAMAEKYGKATGAAREFLAALREIAEEKARDANEATAESLSGRFGGLDREVVTGGKSSTSEYIQTLNNIREELGVTSEEAIRLAAALETLGDAKTPAQIVDAASGLKAELESVLGSYGEMNATAQKLYESTISVGDRASELVGTIDRGTGSIFEMLRAASGLVGQFAAAEWAASGLAGKLAHAVANARELYQVRAATKWVESNQKGGAEYLAGQYSMYGQGRVTGEAAAREKSYDLPARPSGVGSGGSRGGGGAGKAEDPFFADLDGDIQKLERQLDLVGRNAGEVAKLKAEWALLDEAKKRGIDLDKVQAGSSQTLREEIGAQAQAVADLTMALDRQKESQARFEKGIDGIAGAMSRALVGGESLRDGLADVFRSIALDYAKSGIKDLLTSFLGGGKGGGGGFFSGLLGGIFGGAPSFDGGGWTGNGARSGGVDGKGGFPAVLHPRERVIDTTKGQGMGGSLNVTVTMDPSTGALGAFVANATGREIARAAPVIVRESVKASALASRATKGTMGVR